MNPLHTIQGIGFDLDGTLVDSIPDLAAAANAMRAALHRPALDERTIQQYVGDGVPALVKRALGDTEEDPALLAQGMTLFMDYYRVHIAEKTRLYPRIIEGLGALSQRFPGKLALITNKPEALSISLLTRLHLDCFFSVIVGGDTLPQRKPSALLIQYVCKQYAITPSQFLMVGDSVNDVLCARQAGSLSAVVKYGYGQASELGADYIVEDLVDLEQLFSLAE